MDRGKCGNAPFCIPERLEVSEHSKWHGGRGVPSERSELTAGGFTVAAEGSGVQVLHKDQILR